MISWEEYIKTNIQEFRYSFRDDPTKSRRLIKSVPFKTMEALKADVSVRTVLIRSEILAFLMLMLGVAFLQVIAGTLGSGEMLLISFTSVGYVAFIVAPSLYSTYKRIELLDKKVE